MDKKAYFKMMTKKSDFLSETVPSRSQIGWLGETPGRYKVFINDINGNRNGYSWKDIGDIIKAGWQGGTKEDTPIYNTIIRPLKELKKLPQTIRKQRMGSPYYNTPPNSRKSGIG